MQWYVICISSNDENQFREWLRRHCDPERIRCIFPKRKVPEKKKGAFSDVLRYLFPGYALIYTKMTYQLYYQIMESPYVRKFLNYNNSKDRYVKHNDLNPNEYEQSQFFKHISQEEITLLLQLIDEQEVIGYSQVEVINSTVKVISGPLEGKEGIIKKIDYRKKRAKVMVNFMGVEKCLDLGIQVLQRINTQP